MHPFLNVLNKPISQVGMTSTNPRFFVNDNQLLQTMNFPALTTVSGDVNICLNPMLDTGGLHSVSSAAVGYQCTLQAMGGACSSTSPCV